MEKLNSIRMAVGQGELERALDEMAALLETDERFDELLNALRINQGAFQQVKSQLLKGTISINDARQSNSQVADNLLIIADMVERGQLSFDQKVSGQSARKLRWQYFAVGIAVALVAAFLLWKYQSIKEKKCPDWGGAAGFKVMLLPFKMLGKTDGKVEPEVELLDQLDGFNADNGIAADVRINTGFDIEKQYPSSAEAVSIARDCAAQMIVWGKINQKTGDNYTLDVKYKLLDAGGVRLAGDTSITRLLAPDDEGGLTRDIETASRFLFVVIANRLQRSDVALRFMEKTLSGMSGTSSKTGAADGGFATAADSSLQLQAAYAFAKTGKPEKAVEAYSKVLESSPKNWSAMQNRGLARYAAKDWEGAAVDLEMAQSVSKKPASVEMLRIQTESNLKSNRLEAAKTTLDEYKKTRGGTTDRWATEQKADYEKRLAAAEKERARTELAANQKPNDARANLRAANTNLKLGDSKKATQFADRTLKKNPKNAEAWAVKIEAANHEEGPEAAQKVVKEAEASGVQARDIVKVRPVIAPLVIEKKQE